MNEFSSWAREQLALEGAPSLSVAVGLGEDVVFADAVGLADRDQGRPATSETAYLLASVTKPITATAVCLLAEQGAIDLDEDAERYLDGVTLPHHVDGPAPTVRQLLQHRAGLGMHYRFFYDYLRIPVPGFDEVAARYGHIVSTPGTTFEYSNLGYGIVDEVIRSASGLDPAAITRETVFEPLGMPSARVGPSYEGDAPVAVRYAKDGAAYPDYDVDHRGASLAWSSAPDLARFGLAHAGDLGVLPGSVVREMQDTLRVGDGPGAYGLGWNSIEIDGSRVLTHGGAMGGVSTLLVVVPSARSTDRSGAGVAIAALTNGTDSALPKIAVERLLREFVPAIDVPPGMWERGREEAPPVRTPADAVGTWEGSVDTYVGDIAIRLEFDEDGSGKGWLGDEGPAGFTLIHPGEHDVALALPLQLPTPDALVSSPTIACLLDANADTLRGTVQTQDDEAREPEGNCMTHWCQLTRVGSV